MTPALGDEMIGGADRVDGLFGTGIAQAIPEPLLIELILPLDIPVVYARLRSGVDQYGRIPISHGDGVGIGGGNGGKRNVSGFEEMLKSANYLPIRTYLAFEDPTEERRMDTIAPIMELMSKLKDDEQVWYQLVIRPTGEDFKEEGQKKITQITRS